MEETAEVIEDRGSEAVVRIRRHSACAECQRQCGLAGTGEEELLLVVDNSFELTPGERVRIEMEGRNVVLAALLLFFLPILGMTAGYFAGVYISSLFAYENEESIGILVSLFFLGLTFLGLWLGGRFHSFRRKFRAAIIGVISRKD